MARTPVRFLFPGRSDGKDAAPSAEQQKEKTSADGITTYYELVDPESPKSKDWRKKLGMMVIGRLEKEMSGEMGTNWKADKDAGILYMLQAFPERYNLWEHVTRYDDQKNSTDSRDKTRRDTYLYGHPGGPKKRFRTPKEFFWHLYWLMSDPDGDPENCSCKLCVSDELQNEVEKLVGPDTVADQRPPTNSSALPAIPTDANQQVETASIQGADVSRSTATTPTFQQHVFPAADGGGQAETNSITAPLAALQASRSISNIRIQRQARPTSTGRPVSSGRTAPPQSGLAPSAIPTPINSEQAADAKAGSFIYRIGEIVWFQRGAAVGIGIVHNRKVSPPVSSTSSTSSFSYSIQPLSYPNADRELAHIEEALIKPWYAYSPPAPTHKALDNTEVLQWSFDRISWEAALSGTYGPGETEVDASIFAARTVERSYTPIELLPTPSGASNGSDLRFYNGMFIGGEKIWRGDAVRVRSQQQQQPGSSQPAPEILIVTDIIESASTASLAPGIPAPAGTVQLGGDRYVYATSPIAIPPSENTNSATRQRFLQSRIPTRHPTLPDRVAEDLMFQNRTSVPRAGRANSWKLVASGQKVPVVDVKGRWYECARLLPIVNPGLFERAMMRGDIPPDVGRSLNARMDSGTLAVAGEGSAGFRFADRRQVLGRSVPDGFVLQTVGSVGVGTGSNEARYGLASGAMEAD